ncbi:hypothetical protein AX14_008539 [Amanita brunnescens Koide BX004]|nr:hypothetical protein AX14_008539 [Amanita brunnescens Koide BX004]
MHCALQNQYTSGRSRALLLGSWFCCRPVIVAATLDDPSQPSVTLSARFVVSLASGVYWTTDPITCWEKVRPLSRVEREAYVRRLWEPSIRSTALEARAYQVSLICRDRCCHYRRHQIDPIAVFSSSPSPACAPSRRPIIDLSLDNFIRKLPRLSEIMPLKR